MTLPSSGPLSLSDIQGEFGGSNPIGMNEYYAGGGLVPSGTTGTYGAVPTSGQISVQNFYGTSNFVPIYIEDVFSSYLYTGNGSTQNIVNGVNLSAYGGLVWAKARNSSGNYTGWQWFTDTVRNGGGSQWSVFSNNTNPQFDNIEISSFNTNGYSFGGYVNTNTPSVNYVSWTFRKQPKFFDIVTYTGNGVSGRQISHNLGCVPGAIIIKNTSSSTNWAFALATNLSNWSGTSKLLCLNTTDVDYSGPTYSNGSINDATSTTFQVVAFSGNQLNVNQSGETYVAYLFASNAGGFGPTGTDNVITCGSYTGNGATGGQLINLGYEAQCVIIKNVSSAADWWVLDTMRGWTVNGNFGADQALFANSSAAEQGQVAGQPDALGFRPIQDNVNQSGQTYIYIAIRRGPMKVPTVGTSVFVPQTTSASTGTAITTNIRTDLYWAQYLAGDGQNTTMFDRLRGISSVSGTYNTNYKLVSSSTDVESTASSGSPAYASGFNNKGYVQGSYASGASSARYNFTRAPSFLDIVCYTGNGNSGQIITHNLGVSPELIILKGRNTSVDWYVYHPILPSVGHTAFGLNLSESIGAGTGATSITWQPSATTFRADYNSLDANANNINYVAYLFATCSGVSKVGSYTGTAALQTIDCGFTTGARFVLIKRADVSTAATGYPWYVWDSARGISSGNDPYFIMNIGTDAEVTGTNYVDTTSVGFQVTAAASGTVNISGGKFIFLAIA